MPGVGQHHQQRPYRLPAAGTPGPLDVAQAAEVQFGHFPRAALLHPYRSEAAPPPVPPLQETPQRGVGHSTAPLGQQLLDPGHLQPVNGDPPVDLVAPALQQVLGGGHGLPRSRPTQGHQPAQLFLGGVRPFPLYPGLYRRRQVLPDRISGQSRPRRYVSLAVPLLPAPDDFHYVHSGHLLVGHLRTSSSNAAMILCLVPRGGLMILAKWTNVLGDFSIYWTIVPGDLQWPICTKAVSYFRSIVPESFIQVNAAKNTKNTRNAPMAHAGDPDRSHVTMRAISQYRIVYGMVISVDFPKRNRP